MVTSDKIISFIQRIVSMLSFLIGKYLVAAKGSSIFRFHLFCLPKL